jgi:RimJ/RimL family protein N-acetyltransferase
VAIFASIARIAYNGANDPAAVMETVPPRALMECYRMVTVKTERLILFALTREHLEMALNNVDQLAEDLDIQISPGVFSDESRQAMMIKISRMDHAERRLHPWYTYFLLVRSADRVAVGVCGFKGGPTLFGSVELGYAMHEDFRNHGYMTETVRALVDWAFQHDNCRRVTAETLPDNYASQRVLQKAGLTLERSGESMLYWKVDRKEVEEGAK